MLRVRQRIYTPVALLPRNDFKQYNVIALVTTDLSSRQALGGTRGGWLYHREEAIAQLTVFHKIGR